jgi:hypothetical protein
MLTYGKSQVSNQKMTHLEKNFDQFSGLISDVIIQAWQSKAKIIKLLQKIGYIF